MTYILLILLGIFGFTYSTFKLVELDRLDNLKIGKQEEYVYTLDKFNKK